MELVGTIDWVASSPGEGQVVTGTGSVTFGSGGDAKVKNLEALAGNSYRYTLILICVANTTTMTAGVSPNGTNTGWRYYLLNSTGASSIATTAGGTNNQVIGIGGATIGQTTGMAVVELDLQAGYPRAWTSVAGARNGSSTVSGGGRCQVAGATGYDVPTLNDEVTSLDVVTSGLQTGSRALLYRTPLDPTLPLNSDLRLRDVITVGSADGPADGVGSVTFGAGGDGERGFGLSGDTDGLYIVDSLIVANGTAIEAFLELNGSATNNGSFHISGSGSGAYTGDVSSDLKLYGQGGATADGTLAQSTAWIAPRTGIRRPYVSRLGSRDGTGGATELRNQVFTGTYDETSTPITSLEINDGGGAGFSTGTRISLQTLKAYL